MVYYYISRNVKLIQSLMQDYRALTEITPHEYVCECLERFQNIEEQKISWIIEVFLGVHKHGTFLKNIVREAGKLSDLEEDYFVIVTYGILFQISPKYTLDIFKCLFNLSKRLLNSFIIFFRNKDHVAYISQIAQKEYDKYFTTENILGPVLSWQPFLFEISKTYSKYLNKAQTPRSFTSLKNRNTIKIRKNQDHKNVAPNFTPNVKFKVFTNSKIRQRYCKRPKNVTRWRLKRETNHCHYFMDKNTKNNSKFEDRCTKLVYRNMNSLSSLKESPAPKTKTTKLVIKRFNNAFKKFEQNELKWLHDIVDNCENTLRVDKLLKYDQQEKEKEMLLNKQKNHLLGLISREDAIIAKNNVRNEKKRKYNEFIKEKQQWEKEIADWKLKQIDDNRKQVEKMSLIELNLLNSRNSMIEKRKEIAEIVRYDTKVLKELILKNKEVDLEHRINIIKEIKTLSTFAKNSRMHKTVNLNVSPGFGFLCEMSIAELRKRLASLKINLQEELDEKKNKIKTLHIQKKQELEVIKKLNDEFMAEKEKIRHSEKSKIIKDISSTDEIKQLQKILQKKRNQRLLLTNKSL